MEKERLIFCIGRFDHYYDTINNKSSVFLGLSTFIVGGLIAAYPSFIELINCTILIHSLMIVLLAIGIAIMIVVILASTPFQGKDSDSLHYFGSISNMTRDQFCNNSNQCSEEDELTDLRSQVQNLSYGLTSKFNKLKWAGRLFTVQFFLFIPLIILIVFNLK